MKRFLLILVINTVVSYPMWYLTYRRYDLDGAPPDSTHYIDLCHHMFDDPVIPETDELPPACFTRPIRYRILTPLIVQGLRKLQLHRVYDPGTYADFPKEKQASVIWATGELEPKEYRLTLYYFVLADFVMLLFAGTIWVFYAHDVWELPLELAMAGSWAFYATFYNMLVSYCPHVDAGAHLLIVLGLLSYARRWIVAFAIIGILAVFQKEIIILILALYLGLELLRGVGLRPVMWMLAFVPGLATYRWLTWYWPAVGEKKFEDGNQWLTNLARIVTPSEYTLSFVMQHFVGNLPLLAALAGHALLAIRGGAGRRVHFPMLLLLIAPALYVICMMLSVNVGRVVSLGGTLYLVYIMKVVEQLLLDFFDTHRSMAGAES